MRQPVSVLLCVFLLGRAFTGFVPGRVVAVELLGRVFTLQDVQQVHDLLQAGEHAGHEVGPEAGTSGVPPGVERTQNVETRGPAPLKRVEDVRIERLIREMGAHQVETSPVSAGVQVPPSDNGFTLKRLCSEPTLPSAFQSVCAANDGPAVVKKLTELTWEPTFFRSCELCSSSACMCN